MWNRKNYFLLISLSFVLCVSGCNAEEIDFKSMELSEKAFNERQRRELVAYMSLETMFPDNQVRALAAAAGQGDAKKIEELVSQGTNVNSQGAKGATPLFWALRNFNIEGFEKLLDLHADPNIIFADSTVMHWAARHKDTRFLKKALDYGGNPNVVAGQPSETPVFETIGIEGSDNRQAMLMLLDAGADINAVTGGKKIFGMSMGGITPLMSAASLVRFDIVHELLLRGADYRLKDDSGRDLMDRIMSVDGRFAADSEQEKALEKVIGWLSERDQ
jgi:ankyrin repeat protein